MQNSECEGPAVHRAQERLCRQRARLDRLRDALNGVGTKAAITLTMETGESYWVSGVKKNGQDRHRAGSGKVLVEAAAVSHYLRAISAETLDTSRCEITESIVQTDIERHSLLANTPGRA
jgi:hypothetical protein